MLVNASKDDLQPNDYKIRDIIMTDKIPEQQGQLSIYDYIKKHYYVDKAINNSLKYENLVKQCQIRK